MRLDFHTHTTASDGQYSPKELVIMAKGIGLELLAVTDHDTVEGLEEAIKTAKDVGLMFLPGIEISTYLNEEVHILGLGIDEKNTFLVRACEEYGKERMKRGERIIEFLKTKEIELELQEVLEHAGLGYVGRPHFAWALQQHGYVTSTREAFERYLNTKEFHDYTDRKKPTPQEAIALIQEAGGKAVLAHPGLLKMGQERQLLLLRELKEAGLDGVEAYYSQYTNRQIRFYMEAAAKFGLGITAGSDFHGEKVKKTVKLGMDVPSCQKKLFLFQSL